MVRPTEIAEAFAEYYKDLYDDFELNSTENKTQVFLKKLNLPSLSADEASEMIQPITVQEISDTIKNLILKIYILKIINLLVRMGVRGSFIKFL